MDDDEDNATAIEGRTAGILPLIILLVAIVAASHGMRNTSTVLFFLAVLSLATCGAGG